MKAASLFVVLLLAKACVLAGRPLPSGVLSVIAFSWHDAAVVVAAAVLDVAFRRHRAGWVVYGMVCAYVALNVPIARVLSSPLTWPMIHATGGALADSIGRYITVSTLASVAVVLAAALVVPFVLRRTPRAWSTALVAAAVMIVVAGPWAASRVDTIGLERNALTALIPRTLPVVEATASRGAWRESPVRKDLGKDLGGLFHETAGREKDPRGLFPTFSGAARGRNVVLIVLESTAAQYLKPYGATRDPMPNLTRFTENALLFDNAYAAYPESIKGLWSTLCSKFPGFGLDAETQAQRPCAPVAAELAASGYRTGLFHSGRFAYLGMDAVIARQGFQTAEDAGAIGGNIHSSFGVDEPATVGRMLQWVDSGVARQPFLLTYLPIAGHHPYATPTAGPYPVSTESDQYLNALAYADESIATLLNGLRTRGLYDNTMFVIFGDHGEAFGQHPGNAGHTFFLYEENIRVPLIVAIPGVTVGAHRSAAVASLIDVVPTILDLLGIRDDASRDGVSLLTPRDRLALFLTDYSLGWLGLRDGCFKYLYEVDAKRSKLFDVCADAQEQRDLSGEAEPGQIAEYRDHLERWSAFTRSAQRP